MLIRIGALSEQTGVSTDVLRSWERRYGLLQPQRTTGGFRLYGDEDVARVRSMLSLLAAGLSASEAARQVLAGGEAVPSAVLAYGTTLDEARTALHAAFRAFDEVALEAAIDLVLARVDLDTAIRDVFIPALHQLGEDWAWGKVSVAQEHFSVNVLRARLMALARGWDVGFGPRAVLACPPGEYHDVSLVQFGLALRRRGWRIVFLGTDTPLDEVLLVREALSPRLTVLYAADWGPQERVVERLQALGDPSIALAGHTAADAARRSGCRFLEHDPVSAADLATREFAASSSGRQPVSL